MCFHAACNAIKKLIGKRDKCDMSSICFKNIWTYCGFCLFLPRHSLAESPRRAGRAWHIYIIEALLYALVLTIWESRKFNGKSRTKQRKRHMGCIISCLCHTLVLAEVCIGVYIHHRGAFSVARSDLPGNARAFRLWNEWQDRLHVFVSCMLNQQSFFTAITGADGNKNYNSTWIQLEKFVFPPCSWSWRQCAMPMMHTLAVFITTWMTQTRLRA